MSTKFECVEHSEIQDIYIFLVEMKYRSPHLHSDIEIIYLLRGKMNLTTNGESFEVCAGEFVALNSCQLHEFSSQEGALLLIFQISPQNFEGFFPQINELFFDSKPVILDGSQAATRLRKHLFLASRAHFEASDYSLLVCHGYTSLIIHDLLAVVPYDHKSEREQNKSLYKHDRINQISNYINAHYQEKLLLSDISSHLSLSTTYLSRFFRENFGISFQEYLNILRCERARYLLANTENNLLTICELSGFSDIRYLNKAFKTLYGKSPRDFRKENRWQEEIQELVSAASIRDEQVIYSQEQSIRELSNYE
ncbi:AraC family transcriptional regulator [Streptococcaceae bacterium ESL0687]|nr:AraC family transcriptional regulator [Streptococcaceae bacterium ESL0687]